MHRLFIILTVLGILTACGSATSPAQAPQVVEVTKVATVEVTKVVTRVVVITATTQPTAEATVTTQPTAEATAPPIPTVPANSPTASIVNGGNLRSKPNVSASTVIGQVCPGDQVAVLDQQRVATALWYRVQIITTAADCHPSRVTTSTEGWISSSLVSQLATTETALTAEAIAAATATIVALDVTYSEVDILEFAKAPERFRGQKLKVIGEVFAISEGASGLFGLGDTVTRMQIWVQVPGGSDFDREAVVIEFPGVLDGVVKGSTVLVYGTGAGAFEGTNTQGAAIRQPAIDAEHLATR